MQKSFLISEENNKSSASGFARNPYFSNLLFNLNSPLTNPMIFTSRRLRPLQMKLMRMPDIFSVFTGNKSFFSPSPIIINKGGATKEDLLKKENKEEDEQKRYCLIYNLSYNLIA